MWRPDFPFQEQRRAAIAGWQRRFWQASPDHRGVPGAPGRVVTLVREPAALCHGVAFRPVPADWPEIIAQLDVRERNGYDLLEVELVFDDRSTERGMTYIAGPGNPSFVGPAPLEEMVDQIASAVGPSGANRDYLLRLAETLTELEIDDEEILTLRAALLAHERA